MTVTLTDGPLGLEGLHVWTPGDGGPPITLNDLSARYTIRLDKITGLRAKSEADNNTSPRTARPGESPLPSLARGKTLTYEGRLRYQTLRDLRQAQWAMSAAFGEPDKAGTLSVIPNATYGDATHYWQTQARVLQYDPDEDLFSLAPSALPSPYQSHFVLGLRMPDPRWTWTDGQSAGPNTTQVTVTNLGNAPGELVISVDTITGPATVTVFNDTINGAPHLKFVGLPPGTLIIDTAARTARIGVDDFIDAIPYLDTLNSNWWDRGVPGLQANVANTIRRSGGGAGAHISVTFKHTSW